MIINRVTKARAKKKRKGPDTKLMNSFWHYVVSQRRYDLTIPCRSPNFKNTRRHWRTVAGSIERQRLATMHMLNKLDLADVLRGLGGMPDALELVRLGPGLLDDDSVPTSMAAVRDQFCAWLAGDNTPKGKGDDGPTCGISFRYAQSKAPKHGVRLRFWRRQTAFEFDFSATGESSKAIGGGLMCTPEQAEFLRKHYPGPSVTELQAAMDGLITKVLDSQTEMQRLAKRFCEGEP